MLAVYAANYEQYSFMQPLIFSSSVLPGSITKLSVENSEGEAVWSVTGTVYRKLRSPRTERDSFLLYAANASQRQRKRTGSEASRVNAVNSGEESERK
jgi:hypothetical protein